MKRIVLLAVLLGAIPSGAHACAGCVEAVTVAKGQSGEILAGFSWSVLFLLGAVFSAIGGMGALIVRTCKRIERERQGQSA